MKSREMRSAPPPPGRDALVGPVSPGGRSVREDHRRSQSLLMSPHVAVLLSLGCVQVALVLLPKDPKTQEP